MVNCGGYQSTILLTFIDFIISISTVTHLLVIDDHRSIREPLAAFLRRQDFEVTTASDGPSTRMRLSEQRYDLVVLDLMLPGEDGFSLCRHISQDYGTPIIMLTARAELTDRIAGLNLGADDYLTKPFSVDELLARIRTVLRRVSATKPQQRADEDATLEFEGWSLDLLHRHLRDPQGVKVALSTMEFRLLHAFLERPNQVLSRDNLLDIIRRDGNCFDRSIDSQISRLRKKLEDNPRQPTLLKTIWGDGYLLAAQVRRNSP